MPWPFRAVSRSFTHAVLRQCRVRESPRRSLKYPNCESDSLTDRLLLPILQFNWSSAATNPTVKLIVCCYQSYSLTDRLLLPIRQFNWSSAATNPTVKLIVCCYQSYSLTDRLLLPIRQFNWSSTATTLYSRQHGSLWEGCDNCTWALSSLRKRKASKTNVLDS
jgi:hypothetical protein